MIYVNDDNAVINKYYGRLKDIMWLFKIPMVTCKDFFEIYRQFGKRGSPIEAVVRIHIAVWLGYCVVQCTIILVFRENSGSVFLGCSKDGGSLF